MTDPEIAVTLTSYEFTAGELQQFLDTARSIDGMCANFLVVITTEGPAAPLVTLKASTAYRRGDDD